MTSAEIGIMKAENIQLKLDNSKIKKEQTTYKKSLQEEIARIKKLGNWKRFWGSVKLFAELFETIESGYRD